MLTEVQRLTQQLQNTEADLKMRNDALNQSREEIESLSRRLKTSESLLQLEKSRAEEDATFNSISDSSNTAHICQTHTGDLDQSPEADGGRNCSMTQDGTAGGTERQLSERLKQLEKEVRESHLLEVCDVDDLYHVGILAERMLQDSRLRAGCRLPEHSTLFPELLLYLCSSVFIMSPRPLLIFLISSAALMLQLLLFLSLSKTHIQTPTLSRISSCGGWGGWRGGGPAQSRSGISFGIFLSRYGAALTLRLLDNDG